MIFTFLGTSAGAPTKLRNNTALAVQFQQHPGWMLFDCGEGTQHQILKSPLSLHKLKRVFISHLHGDHLYGLPGLLASCSLSNRTETLEVFGPIGIKEYLETTFRISHLCAGFDIQITELENIRIGIEFDDLTLEIVPLSHNMVSFGFVLSEIKTRGRFNAEKAKLLGIPSGPLYKELIDGKTITLTDGSQFDGADFVKSPEPPRKIIICGDNDKPELLIPYLENSDLWVHEATYTQQTFEKIGGKFRHSTAFAVSEVAKNADIANLILTHISPRYKIGNKEGKNSIEEMYNEVRSIYQGNCYIAEDLQCFTLSKAGILSLTSEIN